MRYGGLSWVRIDCPPRAELDGSDSREGKHYGRYRALARMLTFERVGRAGKVSGAVEPGRGQWSRC